MSVCRIKICGVSTPEAIAAAAAGGAHAVGLVFVERSARCVTVEQARELAAVVPPFVETVGLFTDATVEEIGDIADAVGLTAIQLHHERYGPDAIAALAPRRVIRALAFEPETAGETLQAWQSHYEQLANLAGLIVDAPDPTRVGGGTGTAFDWTALRRVLDTLQPSAPLILAGGLDAENVGRAMEAVTPYAVDVSSGVESARGVKDADKIRAFCAAVQRGPLDRR